MRHCLSEYSEAARTESDGQLEGKVYGSIGTLGVPVIYECAGVEPLVTLSLPSAP